MPEKNYSKQTQNRLERIRIQCVKAAKDKPVTAYVKKKVTVFNTQTAAYKAHRVRKAK